MPGSAGDIIEITGIASDGAGVGRLADGRAVFVHRTAPGERVEASVTQSRTRWARARLQRILEPAAERRPAPCPFYARCGGCTLQHLGYETQLRSKARLVADALQRIGGLPGPLPPVEPSPLEFHYRNRAAFTLARLGGERVVAGFHELERPGRVADVDSRCLLLEEPVARAWDELRGAWGRGAAMMPAGARLRLTLRATAGGDVALLIEKGHGPGRPAELLDRLSTIRSIWRRDGRGRPPRLVAGDDSMAESWGTEDLRLGGAVFLQVNRSAAAALETHVRAAAGDVRDRRVVDAYCGVGVHARALAQAGASVTGIEIDAEAVGEARRLAPQGATFLQGSVEARLADALPADLVIVNPPRAGLDAAVSSTLAGSRTPRIIYVSCDPATLARDAARLAEAYRPSSVHCFDLFPQTAHVETVVEFTCATS